MFKTAIQLQGVDETVSRNVQIIIVNDLINLLGLNHDIYTTFDDTDPIDRYKDKTNAIKAYSSPRTEKINVEVEESNTEDTEISLSYIRPDYKPIYNDTDINAMFIPIYNKKKMVFNFKYYNKSKSMVKSIINKLKVLPADNEVYRVHNLEYYYAVPHFCFYLVNEINNKKNNKIAMPMDIETYINSTFDARVDVMGTPDGDSSKQNLIIREVQLGVIGYPEDNISEIKEVKTGEEVLWSLEFNYAINFEYPTQLMLRYPLVVYNQQIDSRFYNIVEEKNQYFKGNFTIGSAGLMDLAGQNNVGLVQIPKGSYYLSIPSSDTFKLPRPSPYYARILSVTVAIDPNDPTAVFNLATDLLPYQIKAPILDLWRNSEYPYITTIYKSLFYIELMKDDFTAGDNTMVCDKDLNLTTTSPMSELSVYRVSINVLIDLNILTKLDRARLDAYFKSLGSITGGMSILQYYAGMLNIPWYTLSNGSIVAGNQAIPYNGNGYPDITYMTQISDNNWAKFYTKQEVLNIAYALERK